MTEAFAEAGATEVQQAVGFTGLDGQTSMPGIQDAELRRQREAIESLFVAYQAGRISLEQFQRRAASGLSTAIPTGRRLPQTQRRFDLHGGPNAAEQAAAQADAEAFNLVHGLTQRSGGGRQQGSPMGWPAHMRWSRETSVMTGAIAAMRLGLSRKQRRRCPLGTA